MEEVKTVAVFSFPLDLHNVAIKLAEKEKLENKISKRSRLFFFRCIDERVTNKSEIIFEIFLVPQNFAGITAPAFLRL